MDLILWRHAEAEEGSDDLARELTRRGQQQASQMASWLRLRLPSNYQVLASEARRSQQTAAFLSKSYHILPELNPDASPNQVLDIADWPNAKHPILIVGHQPYIGFVVARLLSEQQQLWSVKKGAIWWLQHRWRNGIEQVRLKTMIAPSMLNA